MLDNKTATKENLFMQTKGFSMWPFVKENDKIIIKRLRVQDLKIGDIILYKDKAKGQNICHRLVKKTYSENGIILFTRGDASDFLSELVPGHNFIGRVVGIVRNGRVLNLSSRQQIIFNWLIAKFYVIYRALIIFLKQKIRQNR